MALASCDRCGKLYEKFRFAICPNCEPKEEEDYEKIRKSIQDKPGQSAEDVAAETGVELACVLRLLAQGRIETASANIGVVCGRCGAPAISVSKKLCEVCLQKLNVELAMQQSKIALPKKKQTTLGTALNTFDANEKSDEPRGGSRFNR